MFDRFVSLITRYPLWIFGGVMAVVLLVWFSSGSSGSNGSPTIVSVGPSDQTVAANAMIEATRLENQRAGAAGVIAKELAEIQADSYALFLGTSRDIREIDAEQAVSLTQIASTTAINLAASDYSKQTTLASIITGAQTQQTQIMAGAATDLATIDKSRQTDLANIGAALERERIAGNNAAAVAAANSMVTIEQIKGQNEQALFAAKANASQQWWPYPNVLESMLGTPGTGDNVTNVQVGQGGPNNYIGNSVGN